MTDTCIECGARVGHYSKCPRRVPGVIMNNQPEPRHYSTTCPDCGLDYWIDNGHTATACITHLKAQLDRLRNTPCFECGHS